MLTGVLWCGWCCQVDVSKLRVFSMDEDGGSLLTSRVDPQLKEIQHKVSVRCGVPDLTSLLPACLLLFFAHSPLLCINRLCGDVL